MVLNLRSSHCEVAPDMVARAAAKRAREVIAVIDKVTGSVIIRQRGSDSTAVKSGAEAMSVY